MGDHHHGGRGPVRGEIGDPAQEIFPPAQVEYVEKQPSLEDIFLAITGSDGNSSNNSELAMTAPTTKEQ